MYGQGPYRPPPQAPQVDPELARLAAQGEARRMQMMAGVEQTRATEGGRHLATAIGAYRGSTLKRFMLAALVLSLLVGASGAALSSMGRADIGGPFIPGFVVAFILFMVYVFVPPIASPSTVAAEHAWTMSLPFPFTGYFEVLAAQPESLASVVFDLRWQPGGRPADPHLLQSVVAAVDPGARVEHADANGARIVTTPIRGYTGIRVNRVPVYRNHRFPKVIHSVVDGVLVTVHRSHPIAEVLLRRR